MSARGEAPDPILDLLGGKARAQAVSTAAEIGLADVLSDGPLGIDALAQRLGCQPGPLASLLRVLAGLGLLSTPTPDVYALTALGRRLRSDELGPLAAFLGAPEQWDPWSRLRDSLRGGPCAFERTNGVGLYEHLAAHPDAARRYDAGIGAFTLHEARALCAAHDFSGARSLVDVGGGSGALLATVLTEWPQLSGVLFDLPHVVESAAPALAARFHERVRVAGGSFLESVPAGADVYVVQHVLHNWSDEQCVRILGNCVEAMATGARVLVLETVLAPEGRADMATLLDLDMLVLTGGRERRKPELRRLFARAGLSVESARALSPLATLFCTTASA